MTRRRSSTRPSSKSAWHRGPTSGSCSTRIGVMARSSGTTIATPAPHRRNSRMSLVRSEEGGEGRGGERYRRWRLAPGRRWRRRPSPCRRMRGSCSRGGRRRWPAEEREGSGFMVLRGSKGWTRYGKGRGRDLEPLEEGFELGVVVGSGGCHGQCSSSTNCTSEVEGAAEGKKSRGLITIKPLG